MRDLWEFIGDLMLIVFGAIMIYIFLTIEIFRVYGAEANKYIRWGELFMGIPIIALGVNRLIRDIKR